MNAPGGFEGREVSIGVDIGGTFTDLVIAREGQGCRVFKVPSTPTDPSAAVLSAVRELPRLAGVDACDIRRFLHGTTIATNAVLERKGAKTGLITTQGHRDVLEIGRQKRRTLYSVILEPQTPVFLAPRHLRMEVRERLSVEGEALVPMDEESVLTAIRSLAGLGVESIAVSFLYAHLNPLHEQRTRDLIQREHPDVSVSLSSDVDPAFREYERTAVTAFDAYVKPVVNRYLEHLGTGLRQEGVRAPVQVIQSRGGLSASTVAARRPVRLFLSGPAAGVIGGAWAGACCGHRNLITVDIGGTSSDIALVRSGEPLLRPECEIAGYPVRVPAVDVNTIGAGGGSIAWLDGAGGLRVGPQSAGSDPGPACYGRGGNHPTVTDASIVLGYLDPDNFAGGALTLAPEAAHRAIATQIAGPMGLEVAEAALGIHRVMNAQLAEGIRYVSLRQGFDPRDFILVPFGGAGPLHATALAGELGIRCVLIPRYPGVLAAMGLLLAPTEHEVSAAFPRTVGSIARTELDAVLGRLDTECDALMEAETSDGRKHEIRYYADVAYAGQSYHLEIPVHLDRPDPLTDLTRDFCAEHERLYAYSTDSPINIVNLRAVHRLRGGDTLTVDPLPAPGSPVGQGRRLIRIAGIPEPMFAAVQDRTTLAQGAEIVGPAIVEQADSTTLIEPGWRATVLPDGAMMLARDD